MGIFWTLEEADESGLMLRGQEETDGLYFYGYWRKNLPEKLDFECWHDIWKLAEIEYEETRWDTDEYNTFTALVHIKKFPPDQNWKEIICSSLKFFIANGGCVAWCGDETSYASVDSFNPTLAHGNVYAAFTSEYGLFCNSDLNEQYQYLTDKQLLIINKNLRQQRTMNYSDSNRI